MDLAAAAPYVASDLEFSTSQSHLNDGIEVRGVYRSCFLATPVFAVVVVPVTALHRSLDPSRVILGAMRECAGMVDSYLGVL